MALERYLAGGARLVVPVTAPSEVLVGAFGPERATCLAALLRGDHQDLFAKGLDRLASLDDRLPHPDPRPGPDPRPRPVRRRRDLGHHRRRPHPRPHTHPRTPLQPATPTPRAAPFP